MSRVRNYFHAIWSGSVLTVIISLLNLLTIPIAVRTLGKPGYGLWCAVLQLAIFTNIFDLGIGATMARFFTDYKDHADRRAYGAFLKSVFFVGAIQGLTFALAALAFTPFLPAIMRISPEQSHDFKLLVLLQFATTALGFPLRPLNQLLYAHQQIARQNACYIVATLLNAIVLISCLQLGLGIYSYIAASWVAFLVNQSGMVFFVLRLDLLPPMRHAKISLSLLKPLARFSSNVFFTSLGTQLINLAPGLLITRKLGVSVLADWSVGTRLVTFIVQLIGRMPNASEPVFWEMYARQEFSRVRQRLLELLLLTGSAVALMGGGLAAINAPFIAFWMGGSVQWSTSYDLILVVWVLVSISAVVFNTVPGMSKHLGSMAFVYMFEGGLLVAIAFAPFGQLRGYWEVALILLLFEILFRFPYGLWRTWRDLQIPARTLGVALGRLFGVTLFLLGVAFLLRLATASWRPLSQVVVNGLVFCLVALPAIYCTSLPHEPRRRILDAVRRRLGRL